MRYSKIFAGFALAAGIAASTASAQEYRGRFYDRQDLRSDYYRVDAMRDHIARDRARLNEDIRCGRQDAAARDAADLARDQRALDAQTRDIRHDRYEMRRDYDHDGWRWR
jgi:hypothetical protein